MKTIAGIFASRADAERAAQQAVALGIPRDQLTVLSPGAPERARDIVPTDEGEPQGTGAAIGAVVGGATGAAAGMPLGNALTHGAPRDDLFVYEEALRRGRAVVVALSDDAALAERVRAALRAAGGLDVATARDEWSLRKTA
jgi:hypothetical protein